MYLIIEKYCYQTYAYFEQPDHFHEVQPHRGGLLRLSGNCLDEECDLSSMPNNSYLVIPVKSKNSRVGISKSNCCQDLSNKHEVS